MTQRVCYYAIERFPKGTWFIPALLETLEHKEQQQQKIMQLVADGWQIIYSGIIDYTDSWNITLPVRTIILGKSS